LILYINLSKLISPINPFHHYWGHNSYSYTVNGYEEIYFEKFTAPKVCTLKAVVRKKKIFLILILHYDFGCFII